MFIVSDLVSRFGYDPDYPEAKGRVGKCGIQWSTIKDFHILFHDLPLDRMNVVFEVDSPALPALAMYIVYAERMGFPKERLRGNTRNMLYKDWFEDVAKYPPRSSFKLMVELIKYCTKFMPQWNTITFVGYNMEEAGANAVQELAFTLMAAMAVAEKCVEAGLDPDRFLPRFGFYMSCSSDFFENIAKLRALRRMWAKINKDRFGCKNSKALQSRFLVQTAGSSLTAKQPLNNIVRVTLETLSAVLAGANAIWSVGYDEALALPTEESAIMGLRTQQIIAHETNIPNVCDPLSGCYYVEWLTHKIEEEAYKLICEVNTAEEYIRRCENGWFKSQIESKAYEWHRSVEQGERVIVGVNKYQVEEGGRKPIFRINPKAEEIAIERVKKFRTERNNAKTREALTKLREEAQRVNEKWPRGGDLMEAIIEAVRGEATLGEICEVLKEVFGWGYAH